MVVFKRLALNDTVVVFIHYNENNCNQMIQNERQTCLLTIKASFSFELGKPRFLAVEKFVCTKNNVELLKKESLI